MTSNHIVQQQISDAIDSRRPAPQNLEAERAAIGAVILDPSRFDAVFSIVKTADFYDDRCRIIAESLLNLHANGAIDVVLIVGDLKARGVYEECGGVAFLEEATRDAVAANASSYARAVREESERRQIRVASIDVVAQAENGGDPQQLAEVLEQAARRIMRSEKVSDDTGPILTCLADVEPRNVSWLWPGRIPLGRITLLVGRPGEGKSFLTTDIASRVSTGSPWPDGSDCPQGSVILISAEDDPGDTIRPRLDAHRADVRRVHLLSAVRRVDGEGKYERLITLADVDAIETALTKLPDCKLIVVDPIGSFLGSGTDAHRDNEVRGVLAPIAKLGEKHGPAVLVVAHRRKSAGTIADDLAMGSRAFTGIARAVWHLTRDAESKARRLLLPGKNNLAHEGDGLAFSIVGEPARISWERDPVAMNADDALAAESQVREQPPGPDAEAMNAASGWLKAALANGPRLAKELIEEWVNGEAGSKRTLERAKQSLAVEPFRNEVPGAWWWRLPSDKVANKVAKPPRGKQLGDLGDLAETTENSPSFDTNDAKVAKIAKLNEPGVVDAEATARLAAGLSLSGDVTPNRVRVTI